jgi:tRNA(fMet)-specific endonuclease VapC
VRQAVFVLDTNILSIHQRGKGEEYERVRARLNRVDPRTVFVSIVSLHEQTVGWNVYLHRAKKGLIKGYGKFQRMLQDFRQLNILGFDQVAGDEYDRLRSLGVRIGAMDLRIAATALANGMTVVTRNTVDFERVPGLRIEDWTLPV